MSRKLKRKAEASVGSEPKRQRKFYSRLAWSPARTIGAFVAHVRGLEEIKIGSSGVSDKCMEAICLLVRNLTGDECKDLVWKTQPSKATKNCKPPAAHKIRFRKDLPSFVEPYLPTDPFFALIQEMSRFDDFLTIKDSVFNAISLFEELTQVHMHGHPDESGDD